MTSQDILKVIQSASFQVFYEGEDFKDFVEGEDLKDFVEGEDLKDFVEGIDDELDYNDARKKLLTSIRHIFNLES
jgi:hypothetical protein